MMPTREPAHVCRTLTPASDKSIAAPLPSEDQLRRGSGGDQAGFRRS